MRPIRRSDSPKTSAIFALAVLIASCRCASFASRTAASRRFASSVFAATAAVSFAMAFGPAGLSVPPPPSTIAAAEADAETVAALSASRSCKRRTSLLSRATSSALA